jgi:hypothetical protein
VAAPVEAAWLSRKTTLASRALFLASRAANLASRDLISEDDIRVRLSNNQLRGEMKFVAVDAQPK